VDNQNRDLAKLWQAQPVASVDLAQIKQSLVSERRKQRLFMLLDCSAVLPLLYVLYRFWDDFSPASQAFQAIMLAVALPMLVYQLWLRRIAAFYRADQTHCHVTHLIKQIENNVRIAFITKHSTWLASLCMCLFFTERYFYGALSDEKIIRNIFIVLTISGGMAVWYVLANKRQKRLQEKLRSLREMQEIR